MSETNKLRNMFVLLKGLYLYSVQLTYTKVLSKFTFYKFGIQKGVVY